MAILISIQMNCDNPDCRNTVQKTTGMDRSSDALNELFEVGWERRGRKVYCPKCRDLIGDQGQWQNQIGG